MFCERHDLNMSDKHGVWRGRAAEDKREAGGRGDNSGFNRAAGSLESDKGSGGGGGRRETADGG